MYGTIHCARKRRKARQKPVDKHAKGAYNVHCKKENGVEGANAGRNSLQRGRRLVQGVRLKFGTATPELLASSQTCLRR